MGGERGKGWNGRRTLSQSLKSDQEEEEEGARPAAGAARAEREHEPRSVGFRRIPSGRRGQRLRRVPHLEGLHKLELKGPRESPKGSEQ